MTAGGTRPKGWGRFLNEEGFAKFPLRSLREAVFSWPGVVRSESALPRDEAGKAVWVWSRQIQERENCMVSWKGQDTETKTTQIPELSAPE